MIIRVLAVITEYLRKRKKSPKNEKVEFICDGVHLCPVVEQELKPLENF